MRFSALVALAIALTGLPSLSAAQEFSPNAVAATNADNMAAVRAGQMAVYRGAGSNESGPPPSLVIPNALAQSLLAAAGSKAQASEEPPVLQRTNQPPSN